jgi:NAD(P)-dependent dehydrogenase (short-subunit alcohol dehydrogenase family)
VKLAGKVALITGAGRGLGRAAAIAMAREGAAAILVSRTLSDLEETAAVIRAVGGECLIGRGDVSRAQDVAAIVARSIDRFGKIDILVNNAAVVGPVEPLSAMPADEWNQVIAINLSGVLVCSQAVLPGMITRKSGKLINVTSGLGEIVHPRFGPYSVAKAGLIHLTKILAAELAPSGIQVNGLDPGVMDTRMQADVRSRGPERLGTEVYNLLSGMAARGELKPPEAAARLAVFLASGEADHLSGHNGSEAYYRRFGYSG